MKSAAGSAGKLDTARNVSENVACIVGSSNAYESEMRNGYQHNAYPYSVFSKVIQRGEALQSHTLYHSFEDYLHVNEGNDRRDRRDHASGKSAAAESLSDRSAEAYENACGEYGVYESELGKAACEGAYTAGVAGGRCSCGLADYYSGHRTEYD